MWIWLGFVLAFAVGVVAGAIYQRYTQTSEPAPCLMPKPAAIEDLPIQLSANVQTIKGEPVDGDLQCIAIAVRTGQRCKQNAVSGSLFCPHHGGHAVVVASPV